MTTGITRLLSVKHIELSVTLNEVEVANSLYNYLKSLPESSGISNISIDNSTVKMNCNTWVNVERVKRLTESATHDIYRKYI